MAKKSAALQTRQAKTLPEIVAESNEIERMLVEAGGELTPELEQRLAFTNDTLALKVDRYAFIDERLEMNADFWKKKAQHAAKIAKSLEATRDGLRERVKQALIDMNKTEVVGVDSRFVLTNCAKRLEIDPAQLPADMKMVVSTTVPDKERIKAALAEGFEIPGVAFVGGTALRIYENSEEA